MDKPQTRAVFARQPARILLLDFTPPFNDVMCQNIHKALEELFALVCSMSGPSRIPFFGLYTLSSHAENLFPLQHVKGNFQRLYNALQELRSYNLDGFILTDPSDNLSWVLRDSTAQFKRQAQTLRQTSGSSTQLEVTIMTCRPGAMVSKQINDILQELDLTSLRRIQVATIQYSPKGMLDLEANSFMIDDGDSSPPTASRSLEFKRSPGVQSPASDPLALGAVETVSLEQDEICLQEFFRSWLHDSGTDREHLHLQLPPTVVGGDWLTLKCDLQERFLSPSLLPFQMQFDVHSSVTPGKQPTNQPASSKANSSTSVVPVVTLQAVEMANVDGICDSFVFGTPMLVKPTSCWKLDWDELELNQQHFHALCQSLHEKNLALVVRLNTNQQVALVGHHAPRPCGHYILLPSPLLSLLLKPIAPRELMLPTDCSQRDHGSLSDYLNNVNGRLKQLEVHAIYNPLMVRSQLHKSLMGTLVRSSTGTSQTTAGTGRQLKRRGQETNALQKTYYGQKRPSDSLPDSRGDLQRSKSPMPPSVGRRYLQPLTMECQPYSQGPPTDAATRGAKTCSSQKLEDSPVF